MGRARPNPKDPQATRSSRGSGVTIAILAVGSVAGLALMVVAGSVLLLAAWRVSILAWVGQLGLTAAGIWFAVRGRSRWAIVTCTVVVIATLALGTILAPVWRSMARHDARGGAIAAFVCATEQLPEGSTVGGCDSWITNPHNSNQCGYYIALRLGTAATKDELETFYSTTPPAERFGDHLFRADPHVDVEVPGKQASVEVLLIGDEDSDVRCM